MIVTKDNQSEALRLYNEKYGKKTKKKVKQKSEFDHYEFKFGLLYFLIGALPIIIPPSILLISYKIPFLIGAVVSFLVFESIAIYFLTLKPKT
jgi:hypothetical protein